MLRTHRPTVAWVSGKKRFVARATVRRLDLDFKQPIQLWIGNKDINTFRVRERKCGHKIMLNKLRKDVEFSG